MELLEGFEIERDGEMVRVILTNTADSDVYWLTRKSALDFAKGIVDVLEDD